MSRLTGFVSVAAIIAAIVLGIPFPSHGSDGDFPGSNTEARLAVDMHPFTPSMTCESQWGEYGSCGDVILNLSETGDFDAVVVIYNFESMTGVQYALRWPQDWTIDRFTSCSDLTVGGDIGQNPMEVYEVWTSPVYSAGGTSGVPVGVLSGHASSPGRVELLGPTQSLPPMMIDEHFGENMISAWFDGWIGEPSPYEPCMVTPVVDFDVIDPVGSVPHQVTFIDRSNPVPETWYWDFGDGHSSSEPSPTHLYTRPDTYSVYLRIGTEYSMDDTLCPDLVKVDNNLFADFDFTDPVGVAPHSVSFFDRTVPTPTSWTWTFGDGGTSYQRNPTHLYTRCDTFSVRLHVETEYSADDTLCQDLVKVACSTTGVVADFEVLNPVGTVPMDVMFQDRSAPAPTYWYWDFGDGHTSTAQNPTHRYTACDTYAVYLKVQTEGAVDDTLRPDAVFAACGDTLPPPPPECRMEGLEPGTVLTDVGVSNLGPRSEPPVFGGHVISEPTGGFRGLYAPSEADDAAFRALLNAATGGQWDYMDARICVPTLQQLEGYDCVMTWANYAYLDNVAFGNNLADFVDRGGGVVLGAFCAYTSGNFLSGRIMNDPNYCPVTGGFNKFTFSVWSGDYPSDCVHAGVTGYGATYRDILTLREGANLHGTFADGNIAQAGNRASNVSYANGAGGFPIDGNTPAWAQVVGNSCSCAGPSRVEKHSWGDVKFLYR